MFSVTSPYMVKVLPHSMHSNQTSLLSYELKRNGGTVWSSREIRVQSTIHPVWNVIMIIIRRSNSMPSPSSFSSKKKLHSVNTHATTSFRYSCETWRQQSGLRPDQIRTGTSDKFIGQSHCVWHRVTKDLHHLTSLTEEYMAFDSFIAVDEKDWFRI